MENNVFPVRLRNMRKRRGISQKALAELCGLKSKNIIHRYETGERVPNINTLKHMCDVFDVSADYMIGRE